MPFDGHGHGYDLSEVLIRELFPVLVFHRSSEVRFRTDARIPEAELVQEFAQVTDLLRDIFPNQQVAPLRFGIVDPSGKREDISVVRRCEPRGHHPAALDFGFDQDRRSADACDNSVPAQEIVSQGFGLRGIIGDQGAALRLGDPDGDVLVSGRVDRVDSGRHYGDGRQTGLQGGDLGEDVCSERQPADDKWFRRASSKRVHDPGAPLSSVGRDVSGADHCDRRPGIEHRFRGRNTFEVEADGGIPALQQQFGIAWRTDADEHASCLSEGFQFHGGGIESVRSELTAPVRIGPHRGAKITRLRLKKGGSASEGVEKVKPCFRLEAVDPVQGAQADGFLVHFSIV